MNIVLVQMVWFVLYNQQEMIQWLIHGYYYYKLLKGVHTHCLDGTQYDN